MLSFSIYGGLIINAEKVEDLDKGIEGIRLKAGYKPSDEFKFDTRARPTYVTQASFTEAKRARN